jgi:hypothetical protein
VIAHQQRKGEERYAMAKRQSLRHRCSTLLSQIGIGTGEESPPTLTDICDRLMIIRRRAVHLIPVLTVPGSPTGMWLATQKADYVFHLSARQTSPLHVATSVLHEVGHMMLGHNGTAKFRGHVDAVRSTLAADPRSAVMLRHYHEGEQETEAETFAILAVGHLGAVRAATGRDEDAQLYARLRTFLSDATFADGS